MWEGRLERMEITESPLREGLQREKERADRERERADELRTELERARAPPTRGAARVLAPSV